MIAPGASLAVIWGVQDILWFPWGVHVTMLRHLESWVRRIDLLLLLLGHSVRPSWYSNHSERFIPLRVYGINLWCWDRYDDVRWLLWRASRMNWGLLLFLVIEISSLFIHDSQFNLTVVGMDLVDSPRGDPKGTTYEFRGRSTTIPLPALVWTIINPGKRRFATTEANSCCRLTGFGQGCFSFHLLLQPIVLSIVVLFLLRLFLNYQIVVVTFSFLLKDTDSSGVGYSHWVAQRITLAIGMRIDLVIATFRLRVWAPMWLHIVLGVNGLNSCVFSCGRLGAIGLLMVLGSAEVHRACRFTSFGNCSFRLHLLLNTIALSFICLFLLRCFFLYNFNFLWHCSWRSLHRLSQRNVRLFLWVIMTVAVRNGKSTILIRLWFDLLLKSVEITGVIVARMFGRWCLPIRLLRVLCIAEVHSGRGLTCFGDRGFSLHLLVLTIALAFIGVIWAISLVK